MPAGVEETAIQIINLEQQLQSIPEQVKAQIDFYNKTRQDIENLKQRLKENTSGKIKESYSIGDNTLDVSIYDSQRVSVTDPQLLPKEYTTKVKQEGVYLDADGNYYKDEPNTKLISNIVKVGGTIPEGCSVKTSRSISIKFNGETL